MQCMGLQSDLFDYWGQRRRQPCVSLQVCWVIESDENECLTKSEIKTLNITCHTHTNAHNSQSKTPSTTTAGWKAMKLWYRLRRVQALTHRLHGPDISHTSISKAKHHIHIFMIHMHYSHERPFHVVYRKP